MVSKSSGSNGGATVDLSVPVRDSDLFKHGATGHVLNFLADNPDIRLSIRQLSDLVPYSRRSTRKAVDVLEANELVVSTRRENARLVQINRERLNEPTDPVLSIPQEEFHLPVRLATLAIREELENVEGIVLFGSVARGEADRQSDVDLWVLVGEDPARQQHLANELATRLSATDVPTGIDLRRLETRASDGEVVGVEEYVDGDQTPADGDEERDLRESYERVLLAEIGAERQQVLPAFGDAQRYTFEIVVESPQTVLHQLDEIEPEIFTEGITLHGSRTLSQLKEEVVDGE